MTELPDAVRDAVLERFRTTHSRDITATVHAAAEIPGEDGCYRVMLTYRWAGKTLKPSYRYEPPPPSSDAAFIRQIHGYHADETECWGGFCRTCNTT